MTSAPQPRYQWLPYAAVLVAVVLANVLYLSHHSTANPLVARANISQQVDNGRLSGDYALDPNDGATSQTLGTAAAHQLADGDLPWWNSYEGLGAPLAGEMQSAALFPLTPLLLLPGGFLLRLVALELIGGWATVALARRWGTGTLATTLVGVVYATNGVAAWFHHAPAFAAPFVPLMLWSVERALAAARDGKRFGWLPLGATLGAALYSGFPETVFLGGLLTAVLVVLRFVGAPGFRLAFVRKLAGGSVLGLLLAAPILTAFLGYLASGADVGGHGGGFGLIGLRRAAFGNMFAPYSYGPIFGYFGSEEGTAQDLLHLWMDSGGYVSLAVLTVAVVGVTGSRMRGLRLSLGAWTILALLKTFGVPGVTQAVNHIPGIASAAFYRYAYPTWILAVLMLAGLAVDDACRGTLARWRVVVGLGAAGLVGIPALLEARAVAGKNAEPQIADFYHASYAWAGLSVVLVVGLLMIHRPWARVGVALVLALESVVLFAVPTLSAKTGYVRDTALVSWLENQGRKSDDGSDLSRVYSITDRLSPNYGSYFGVAQLNVNDLPVPGAWSTYVAAHLRQDGGQSINFYDYDLSAGEKKKISDALVTNVQGYRDAAVGYVIASAGYQLEPDLAPLLTPVLHTQTADVYRLIGSVPYAAADGCTVTPSSRTDFAVDCAQSAVLVRRELMADGWTATVDGKDAPVTTFDATFQQVGLAPGQHRVRFSYAPPGATTSLLALAVGLLVIVGAGGTTVLDRRGRPAPGRHVAGRPRAPSPAVEGPVEP